jgi:hypothetical protein
LLYVEQFQKRPIREPLSARGFTLAFRKRAWWIFGMVDEFVAISPVRNPSKG